MKKTLYLFLIFITLTGCQNNSNQKAENGDEFESFKVKETMLAGGYVYVLGEQDKETKWFAFSAQEVNSGEVYYYSNPLVMVDFYSKELDRPFDEIVFLSRVSKDISDLNQQPIARMANKPSGKINTDQQDLQIEIPTGALSIAQLFEQKDELNGKKVKVRGKAVKFNAEIMNTNWIHIQDGTSFDGNYDLTITSDELIEVGEIFTFEGIVAVNKDFGYGYFYELLLEESKTIK